MKNIFPSPSQRNPFLPQELLLMFRQRSGLTQVQLAARLGLKSERMVQNWEGGYGLPKPARLRGIIELYLGLSVFIKGQEEHEARQLWESVKNLFDTNSLNFEMYQIFDQGWFQSLLKAAELPVLITNNTLPLSTAPTASQESRYNLPYAPNLFIGRQQEVKTVCDLLQRSYIRLVTIVGPGGIGKTRLGLEVASRLQDFFKDGVCVVELAALTDPGLLPQAIALALGLREDPGRPFPAILGEFMAGKQFLLVLDNTEHLVEACANLANRLLQSCPGLKILATGRETFNTPNEVFFRLPALRLPPLSEPASPESTPSDSLSQYEAIELFLARAEQAQPGFKLAPSNASSIVQVCRLLDGIPLSLELAASRLRIFSIEEIARRLDNTFSLLTGHSRTAQPRQQTMRASLDWSYGLLTETERVVLRRLAVFRGGWSVEAAEAVCAGPGVSLEEVSLVLEQLLDKSLVVMIEETTGPKRLRLLEIVRQYAAEKLSEAGEEILTRDQHLAYFSKELVEIKTELHGPNQLTHFLNLETTHDNLRAALEWSLQPGEPSSQERLEKGLRLANSIYWFWFVRGFEREGQVWLEKLYRASEGKPELVRERALASIELVILAWGQHNYDTALQAGLEAETLFRQLNDDTGIAFGWGCQGIVLFSQKEYERGQELLDRCLAVLRRGQINWLMGHFVYLRATTYLRSGQLAEAYPLYQESLAIFRKFGDLRWQGWVLYSLGHLKLYQRDSAQAAKLLEENLRLFRLVGDKRGIPWSLQTLGSITLEQGDYATAETFLRESFFKHRQQLTRAGMVCSLEWLVVLAEKEGLFEQAARLVGATEALRQTLTGSIMQAYRADYAASRERVREQLGETEFDTQTLLGQQANLEELIEQVN